MPLTIFSRAQRGIPKLAIRAITGTAKNLEETSEADLADTVDTDENRAEDERPNDKDWRRCVDNEGETAAVKREKCRDNIHFFS